MKTYRSILALSVGMLGLVAAHASAQTVITSVPYTISTAGQYVLGGNLNSSSANNSAIYIAAPNVVLDLNNYYVAGPSDPSSSITSTSHSVIHVADVPNVTIKNGTVAGHVFGINYESNTAGGTSRNYVLDHVTVTRCYYEGVFFKTKAPGSVIRNCTFSTIGGSTYQTNQDASAIYTHGSIRMENNIIDGVTATGNGTSYGVNGFTGDTAYYNSIANCKIGLFVVGKYIGNLTNGVTTNFSGGTAVGDNN